MAPLLEQLSAAGVPERQEAEAPLRCAAGPGPEGLAKAFPGRAGVQSGDAAVGDH